jgi:hypothetical protein
MNNQQDKFISNEELLVNKKAGSAILNNDLTQYVRVWCKSKFTLFYDFTVTYPTTLEVVLNKGTLVSRRSFNLDYYSDFHSGIINTRPEPCIDIHANKMKVVSETNNNIFSFFSNNPHKKYYAMSGPFKSVRIEIGKTYDDVNGFDLSESIKSSKFGVLFPLNKNASKS